MVVLLIESASEWFWGYIFALKGLIYFEIVIPFFAESESVAAPKVSEESQLESSSLIRNLPICESESKTMTELFFYHQFLVSL